MTREYFDARDLCEITLDEYAYILREKERGYRPKRKEVRQIQNAAVVASSLLSERPSHWHKTMVLGLAVRGIKEVFHSRRQQHAMHSTAFAALPTARNFVPTAENMVLALLPEAISEELSESHVS